MLKIKARLNCDKQPPRKGVLKVVLSFTNIMREPPFLLKTTKMDTERKKVIATENSPRETKCR
jgi:hypothetical protein